MTETIIDPLWFSSWDDLLRVLRSEDPHCLFFFKQVFPLCTFNPCKVPNSLLHCTQTVFTRCSVSLVRSMPWSLSVKSIQVDPSSTPPSRWILGLSFSLVDVTAGYSGTGSWPASPSVFPDVIGLSQRHPSLRVVVLSFQDVNGVNLP